MAMPTEFYVYVGYGLFAMIAVTGILAWMLGGFLGPFLKVKRSRGQKILVRVHHSVQDYFRAGYIAEGFLVFEDKQKNVRRLPMQPGVVSRAATVYWVEVDDLTNAFFKRDTGEAVASWDAAKVDSLITRALMKPGLFGDNTIKVLLILSILLLVAVGVVGFLTYKNGMALQQIAGAASAAGVGVVA